MMRVLIIAPEESVLDYGMEGFLDWVGMNGVTENPCEVSVIFHTDSFPEFLDMFEPHLVLVFVTNIADMMDITARLYLSEDVLDILEFETNIILSSELQLPTELACSTIPLAPGCPLPIRVTDNRVRH